jgi:hypothetical protein
MWATWRGGGPAAAKAPDAEYGTPLAGPYPAPLGEVRAFTLGAIEDGDSAKLTAAIHLCCATRGTPMELLRQLAQAHPRGLQQRLRAAHPPVAGELGELLPLHRALFGTGSVELVTLLLDETGGYGIKERAGNRLLPLHIGERARPCHLAAGCAVAGVLLAAKLPLLAGHTSYARVRAHAAVSMSGTALATVGALVDRYPKALAATDGGGLLPLHVAIQHQMPMPVIELLLERTPAGPRAATRPDHQLPLHVAASVCAPLPLLTALLEAEPAAATSTTKVGWTPLHCAVAPVGAAAAAVTAATTSTITTSFSSSTASASATSPLLRPSQQRPLLGSWTAVVMALLAADASALHIIDNESRTYDACLAGTRAMLPTFAGGG